MLLDRDDLTTAFRKARQVIEHYNGYILGGPNNYLSVDDLTWVVQDMYDVEVERYEVDFEAKYTRGMMRRTQRPDRKDLVEIDVRLSLESSWKRLTVVKELSHVVVDEREDWSPEAVKTIRNLQADLPNYDRFASRTSASETLAELVAVELMYPYDQRLNDVQDRERNGRTISQIANAHGMPTAAVSRAISEQLMELAKEIWSAVDEG